MAHRSNEWHLRDPEAVASVLDTDIYRGLEPREVHKRRRREGKNKIWHVRRASATEYALRSLGDLTGAVLVIAALTAAIFERSTIAMSVCVILAVGVIFRVITYVKARRILESMADEGIPSATVIRGGASYVVRADDIVVGDVVMLGAGDIVPCDGRIVFGDEIRVSEQGITENKTSVIKGDTVILTDTAGAEIPCEYRVNMLFAGSAILAGNCRIVATACGDDALVSMRRGGLLIPSGDEVPVLDKLSEWCRKGSVFMLLCVWAISGLSVALHLFRGSTFSLAEAFIDAMAIAAASVSSYLVTAGYVTLTIPLKRLIGAKNGRTVVKDVSGIERIADISCIISSDIAEFKSGRASYTAYFSEGELRDVKMNDKNAGEALADILKTVVNSHSKTSIAGDATGISETELLLEKITESAGSEFSIDPTKFKSRDEIPVDYKSVKSAHGDTYNVILKRGADYEIHLSGDLRDVLSFCDKQMKGGREVPLNETDRNSILKTAMSIEARGGNIIAKAHRKSIYTSLKRLSVLQSNMCFDGFIAIEEGLDAGVSALKAKIQNSALSVVLLSSNSMLDRGYLARAGILNSSAPIISCRDVLEGKALPDGSYVVAVPARGETGGKIDAAAKVRMATVRKLTEAIDGAAVITSEPSESGMMTDKAVGAAISNSPHRPIPQTLKRRADISVYPKNEPGYGGFAETVRTISAAVCSLENLRRAALYTVTSQCARLACMLLSIITDIPLMNAASILLLGMIFDFAAALVLSFSHERCEVTDGNEEKRKIPVLKDVLYRSLIGAFAGVLAFTAAVIPSYMMGIDVVSSGVGLVSASTVSLLLMQLVILSEFILDGGVLYRSGETNFAYLLYAVLSLATVLAIMFSGRACSFIGDVCPGWVVSTVSAAGAVILLGVYELLKLVKRKKD